MKLIFTTQGTDWDSPMDPRFGRARDFFVFDPDTEEVQILDNTASQSAAHGAGPQAVGMLAATDARILITGNGPGGNAATALQALEMEIYVGAGEMTVQEAYDAYKKGTLTKFAG